MNSKEAYQKTLQENLDKCSAEIDKFKAKTNKTETVEQLEYYKKIEELRTMQSVADRLANNKLSQLKEDCNDAWGTLGDALKSATSKIK